MPAISLLAGRPSHARYCHKRLASPKTFARASFRVVSIGKGKKMVVGCPRGEFDRKRGRCRVGTRGQAILKPIAKGHCCPTGYKLGRTNKRCLTS